MKQFKVKIKSLLVNNDQLLIVKRWYDDRIVKPYQWEFIDGDLNFGETPEDAAERLVREQTQIEVSDAKLLYTWSYTVGDVCYVGICFGFNCVNREVFLSEELIEYYWADRRELNDSEHPMNEKVILDVLANSGGFIE